MDSKCQWYDKTFLYLSKFSFMNEPNCSAYHRSLADKWSPQGRPNFDGLVFEIGVAGFAACPQIFQPCHHSALIP